MPSTLPPPESVSLSIDVAERLRAFDIGPEDSRLARELWTILEPEAQEIAVALWDRRRRVYGNAQNWAPHDQDRMHELAVTYLRNLFTDLGGVAWVQSADRTVASAYAVDVGLTPILAMIDAGGRATYEILRRRLAADDERMAPFTTLLLKIRSLEGDVYCALFSGYCRFSERAERDRLSAEFSDTIAGTVEETSQEGGVLRRQASASSASARGVLGKASEVAAAAEQSAVAMREAAQTAAGLIRGDRGRAYRGRGGGRDRQPCVGAGRPGGRHVGSAERSRQVDRIDPGPDPRHRRADQPAGAQRHDRGGARG